MTESATAMRIPETMGPSEIGAYLRGLREHFNLTPQDVSERLHIRPRYVTAIEEARFSDMPGKAYARGYVQSYAEFLGLDAEQVVAQCFREEDAVSVTSSRPSVAMVSPVAALPWRPMVGLVVAVITIGLIVMQWMTAREEGVEEAPTTTVASVPEAMLVSMRSGLMPTAQNYECLTGAEQPLECFFAQQMLTRWSAPGRTPIAFGFDVDHAIIFVTEEAPPLAVPAAVAPVPEETPATPNEEPAPFDPNSGEVTQ